MTNGEKKKEKEELEVDQGYFDDDLPYTRIGSSERVLVDLEAGTWRNAPPKGYMLNVFLKTHELLAQEFTVYLVGRKPNMPQDYVMSNMADDYAKMIKREFGGPVDVMGVSTGGQIAHFLAADHPYVVRKLVIVSAAYRLSDKGVEIERRAAEYAEQGKYNKSFAVILDLLFTSRLKRALFKFIVRLFGGRLMGKIEDPSDFLITVKADRLMNFKDRLSEIKAPTLVLSGELDLAYTVEDVRETAEGIPNAKLILYKNYGHDLFLDHKEQVQRDIIEFLKEK